ncbi:MAG: type II secretion system protein [Bdellovibrionaceae bacterium]|nr:type II secretion system protein [Pseudobdellovibrionaceae bacterium]
MSRTSQQRGFSLIEILIVLGLVAVLVTTFASKMGKSNRAIRRDVRYFAASLKDLRNKARMRNMTYRLVINLPENKKEKQAYWIEATSKHFLVTYDEEELRKQKKDQKEDLPDPSGFAIDKELSPKGPQPLPDGLSFSSIEIAAQQKEFTAGRLYVHFFPEGRVEEVAIHLTDGGKLNWTLKTNPLTGRVDVLEGDKKLKDLTK